MASIESLPDWERLLAAERHLQYLIPGAVLVGGTAAALHAHHRISMDGDHVVERLATATPADLAEIDLRHYRALQAPWNGWDHVAARGRHWAQVLARVVLEGER